MDSESDVDTVLFEDTSDVGDSVLGLAYGHTVARDDDDVFGIDYHLGHCLRGCFSVLLVLGFGDHFVGVGPGAENHIVERSVHSSAHNIGKNSA